MTKLGKDDYDRPKHTKTEKLTMEEIKEKLEDYVEIDDISVVPLDTHLRYFAEVTDEKTGKKKKIFRLGGFLKNKNNYDKYVVLSSTPSSFSNGKTWSANTKTSIFYKKMTIAEIKEAMQDEIDELKTNYNRLKKENKKLKEEIKQLQK